MRTQKNTILKEFVRYVSFNVCSMVGTSCYILADTFFVANGIGADGLTALNLAIPIFGFMTAVSIMLGIGTAAKYAILSGQKNTREANTYFTHALDMGIVIGILLAGSGQFFAHDLAALMGADKSNIELTAVYIKTTTLFAPFFLTNNLINAMVKNDSAPKLAMIAMLAGSFSNIILDYIFVFPLQMGMFGAALATGIAPVISLAVLAIHILTGKNHFHLQKCARSIKTYSRIMFLGLSPFIIELSSSVVVLTFNMVLLKQAGSIGVAAYGIIANLALVVTGVYNGIAQGIQPMISKRHGAEIHWEIQKIIKYALTCALSLSVIMYLVIVVFRSDIINIFNKDDLETLYTLAYSGIPVYFAGIFFVGINMICAIYFTSVERIVPASVISLMRGGVVIIPAVLLLSHFCQLHGVWASFPVTEAITAVTAGVLLIRYRVRPDGADEKIKPTAEQNRLKK